jgi:uncharacterized protein YggE
MWSASGHQRVSASDLATVMKTSNISGSSRSVVVGLGVWKRALLVVGSLAFAYAVALVTFIIRWIHFWMRGPSFEAYLTVFLMALALLLYWWTSRHQHDPLPLLSTVIYSVVAGYVAGVLAMVLYPIFQDDGLQHSLDALKFPTIEAGIAFFWFPVRLLTWLFGGITGGMMLILSRRWKRMRLRETSLTKGGRKMMASLLTIVLIISIAAQAHGEPPDKPAVTVIGHGHLSLPPDTAFVTLGIETTGKTVADAQRQNHLVMNKVVQRLRALPIENERIQTASFTVSPQYKPPPSRSEPAAEPPEIIGYVITNTVTVEVRSLDKVGPVIEESLAAGANQFQNLHWALRDEQQAKLAALKQAAARAREKAVVLTEALNVKVIRLLTAHEESHVVRPMPKAARSMMAMEGGETPLYPGEVRVDATVTLMYEVGNE